MFLYQQILTMTLLTALRRTVCNCHEVNQIRLLGVVHIGALGLVAPAHFQHIVGDIGSLLLSKYLPFGFPVQRLRVFLDVTIFSVGRNVILVARQLVGAILQILVFA